MPKNLNTNPTDNQSVINRQILEQFVNDPRTEVTEEELNQILEDELNKPENEMDMQLIDEILEILEPRKLTQEEIEAGWEKLSKKFRARQIRKNTVIHLRRALIAAAAVVVLFFVSLGAARAMKWTFLLKYLEPIAQTFGIYTENRAENNNQHPIYQAEIEKEYNDLVNRLQLLGSCKNNTDIAAMMSEIKVDLNDDTYLDMARARVLGSNVPITEAEYANALFVYFRGSATPIDPMARMFEKNIDGNRVHQAAEQYFNSRAQEAKIRRDQAVLKAEALKEKVKLRTLNPNNYLSGNMKMESEARQLYNSIVGLKCRRVKAVCDIYRLLFSAKIDALRDYTLMNKEILLEACKEIVREG